MIPAFFSKRIFFGRTSLKLIEIQEKLEGSPGPCSPGKFACCNGYFSAF